MNNHLTENVVKSGESVIVSEEKYFYYNVDYGMQPWFRHWCSICDAELRSTVFQNTDRDYGPLYRHLEQMHGVLCIESTADKPSINATCLKYRKLITFK